MRKLQIDLGQLAMAFEDASWERRYFLDLETGQVVWITQETGRQLESIYEETYDPESEEPVDLAEVLRDLADWQKEDVLEADRIERLAGSRYIGVLKADSHEGYRDMERFIPTVQDEHLQERLWQAVRERGAFRRFKDVLAAHYREEKRLNPVTLNKSCRYCPPCDLIIAHQDEIETQLTILFSERAPSLIGNEYLVMGTLDRAIWWQSHRQPMPVGELLDHLHVFEQVLQFEPEHYGWVRE